jgi:hypothetical protein
MRRHSIFFFFLFLVTMVLTNGESRKAQMQVQALQADKAWSDTIVGQAK